MYFLCIRQIWPGSFSQQLCYDRTKYILRNLETPISSFITYYELFKCPTVKWFCHLHIHIIVLVHAVLSILCFQAILYCLVHDSH